MSNSERIAVLDIGTNTVILLVAESLGKGAFRVLHDEARVVRLGEGINDNPAFLPAAMERVYAALADFKTTADSFSCSRVIAVGTAAFRNARNAADFVGRVSSGLGMEIGIISGEKEAELIFKAALADFSDTPPPWIVLDIGGGSTEFIFKEENRGPNALSLPFGSVKLTERHLKGDPPLDAELRALDADLDAALRGLPDPAGRPVLIATAGTATTVSAMVQNLSYYDPARVHRSAVGLAALDALAARLGGLSLAERAKLPCLEPRRADVIVAGCHILQRVCRRFGVDGFLVSDRGLRYGVLLDAL